jgi:hypothetical protein
VWFSAAQCESILALENRLSHSQGHADFHVKFFSTLASLGVPYDITLHELRVECFFPADTTSEDLLRGLAG